MSNVQLIEECVRRIVLDDRYEYSLHGRNEMYYVTCHDLRHNEKSDFRHGPFTLKHPNVGHFTLEEAHAFIDMRVTRYKDLDRDEAMWTLPPSHESSMADTLVDCGREMMNHMRVLDAENAERRATRARDLSPIIPARDDDSES